MKAKLISLTSMVVIFTIALSLVLSSATLNDYSATGWSSSNGQNSMPGIAKGLTQISSGANGTQKIWSFYCEGDGLCYLINGNNLMINHEPGPINGNSIQITIESTDE